MYHDFFRNRSLFIAWGRGGGGSGLCVGGGGGLCVGEYLISPKDSLLSLLYSPPLRLLSFPSFTVPP